MRDLALIAVLAMANFALFAEHLTLANAPGRVDGGFQAARFERELVRSLPSSRLVSEPFAPSSMIPETHVHLRSYGHRDSLSSIYVGYYPRLGVLEERPHDPVVCYQGLGYEVSVPEELRLIGDEASFALQRIVVRTRDAEGVDRAMTVFYWTHFAGQMPVADSPGRPTPRRVAAARYGQGRTDLAWVRVELKGSDRQLDDELRQTLLLIIDLVAAAMR